MSDSQTAAAGCSAFTRLFLLALVALTGGIVLVLEILGTRVIGTYYGSSIYVWAALLTVTLVCLAIGYAAGGRLADRVPRAWVLYLLIMAAGGTVLAIPHLDVILAPLGERLGLAGGAIASAAVIFFLPLTLLATASPYVIRLRARALTGVGSTSGAVYAVSTIGSVAGVLAVSLWMIPTLGTNASLLVSAGVLIGLGAAGLALSTRGRATPTLLLVALTWPAMPEHEPAPGELYFTESAYGQIRVLQREAPNRGPERALMVNGILQTGMPLDIDLVSAGAILGSDQYHLELLPYFHDDLAAGRQGVLIGLAGGMFPRVMEFYEIDWTAVEIDPEVGKLAKAYFGYRGELFRPGGEPIAVDLSRYPNRTNPLVEKLAADGGDVAAHAARGAYRGRAVIQDGRQYLIQNPQRVAFIVVDAYNSDTIPFHLITREFFELVHGRLADDGILAINYIGRPRADYVTDSLLRTLAAVFGSGNLRGYRSNAGVDEVQVMTLFAFRRPMELQLDLLDQPIEAIRKLHYDLSQRRMDTARTGGEVITDDRNPIDLARAETALLWRRNPMHD